MLSKSGAGAPHSKFRKALSMRGRRRAMLPTPAPNLECGGSPPLLDAPYRSDRGNAETRKGGSAEKRRGPDSFRVFALPRFGDRYAFESGAGRRTPNFGG